MEGYAEHIENYRRYLIARNYAKRTVETYIYYLKAFMEYLTDIKGIERVQDITRETITEWQIRVHAEKNKTSSKPLSTSSKSTKLQAVKSFCVFLTRTTRIMYNPSSELELPRQTEKILRDILKRSEINKLIEMAKGRTLIEIRDRAIMEVLYSSGLRNSELRDLKVEDIDLIRKEVIVFKGKGGGSRVLPLGRLAAAWVETYMNESRPKLLNNKYEDRLFLNQYGNKLSIRSLPDIVQKYARRAGIKKRVYAHMFRHTCATHLLRGGADIRYVQDLLGHASLDSTKVYTKIEIGDLKRVHKKSHPREKI